MERETGVWRLVFLALPLGVFTVLVIWPLASSFYYSFTNWNGFSDNFEFVGFSNFNKLWTDKLFFNAAVNTAIWMVAAVLIPTLLGLGLALLIDSRIPGGPVFKSIFYFPICLSAVVVGQIWIWIYQPDWGLLNVAIGAVTGSSPDFAWLAKPDTALGSVIAAWAWQHTGLAMVIYLAGLTSIPEDLLEVCEIEGASTWQRLRVVIIPLLTPATVVVVALNVINSLKGFEILYIMTGGGPFNSSDTLAMHMYNESFKKYLMGYGSAISVVLFIVALTIIGIYFRELKKVDEIYG
ncbi:MAG: sugar ABC transporter permease [Hoeflea sp.]|uniref:carbohydrate ABC transporter permease n=1 Tax=Hoeflea sp. TaxID=1940281 RepID=UPI001D1BFA6A|nr:sugar ABC transporter permease [Hoeflea sp.]MBU4528062.1 sugar ABC transporter permease [Alphaproteobacteria bacterium]MBU4543659.1 sugar ABC transporter permease [Alphaproteobacteria bacterium]MBU4548525.1 sugar ABC transporter permease [Alphaproteobacteria bacterium]MBV1725692.1 sugar ABC transporter permease [Hoeflea sp.]MBV1762048.1 sugar ABC transporter permease [Hoeflea sp.]